MHRYFLEPTLQGVRQALELEDPANVPLRPGYFYYNNNNNDNNDNNSSAGNQLDADACRIRSAKRCCS